MKSVATPAAVIERHGSFAVFAVPVVSPSAVVVLLALPALLNDIPDIAWDFGSGIARRPTTPGRRTG